MTERGTAVKPEIRHIGVIGGPYCGADIGLGNAIRGDLSVKEYLDYERHPLKGDFPFRICRNCLRSLRAIEKDGKRLQHP